MNSMNASATFEESDYEQHEALLGDQSSEPQTKRTYQNSDRTLLILGAIGSFALAGLIFGLVYLFFGPTTGVGGSASKPPKWGDIGCAERGEIFSPLLEQNLTLYEDSLEIVTTGTSIGDIMFHTEPEDELEYVRLDVSLQGPLKSDLQTVYTRVRAGRYELQSPEIPRKCMRYTLDVWLPRRLTSLTIRTDTLAHVSFENIAPDSTIYALNVKLGGDAQKNLLRLPEAIIANAYYSLINGYVVGTTMLYNSLKFEIGQAQMDTEIVLTRNKQSTEIESHELETLTSSKGLHKIIVKNPNMYPISAHHESTDTTWMYLEYPATFNGEISTATNRMITKNSEVAIGSDSVVFKGSQSEPRSNLRIRSPLGTAELVFV